MVLKWFGMFWGGLWYVHGPVSEEAISFLLKGNHSVRFAHLPTKVRNSG